MSYSNKIQTAIDVTLGTSSKPWNEVAVILGLPTKATTETILRTCAQILAQELIRMENN